GPAGERIDSLYRTGRGDQRPGPALEEPLWPRGLDDETGRDVPYLVVELQFDRTAGQCLPEPLPVPEIVAEAIGCLDSKLARDGPVDLASRQRSSVDKQGTDALARGAERCRHAGGPGSEHDQVV